MKLLNQLLVIFGLCLVSEGVSMLLPFAFPGGVIAMLLMLALLLCGALKKESIRPVCDFLLANMAMLFIPAGVSIINQYDMLRGNIIRLFLVCLISTILTFATVSITVTAVTRITEKRGKHNG